MGGGRGCEERPRLSSRGAVLRADPPLLSHLISGNKRAQALLPRRRLTSAAHGWGASLWHFLNDWFYWAGNLRLGKVAETNWEVSVRVSPWPRDKPAWSRWRHQLRAAGKDPSITVTHIRAHLSQPSSKLSQLFINMKLCLSQVEQWDFLPRHAGIVWPPLLGRPALLHQFLRRHIVQESISLLIVCRTLICP